MERGLAEGSALTMLLLDSARLDERRAAAAPGGPLGALADSIAADLEIVMARELYVPREKALLSRAGGRCEADGTQLEFDPYSPDEHRCPKCGSVYTGEFHHRWWVYWYQLWLAERGVNAALLYLLRGETRHRAFANAVAKRYAELYETYPNVDNVLGPTRLFFSTYLESIWLVQICVMASLLELAGDLVAAYVVRKHIAPQSSALIAQYDEGMSNRQVWNNAAMMASALLLGDRERAEGVVRAASGVEAHLAKGLLDDGTWYEGENYHLFAHRGLWYCIVLAETAGIEIDPKLMARFHEGFATPFMTALPDYTLPSRKDSQYAISLRQPRFAESCELGFARTNDRRLLNALVTLYESGVARGDTNRARSTADVERNLAATALTRADLGWRSLLHARVDLPMRNHTVGPAKSVSLSGQGFSVFRREKGEVYVALDWGQSGGGHGHPDRLNLLFMHGSTRWLDDMGTGSYVDPSLHWFRSTLAHNAPTFGSHSQARVDGKLLAYEERDGAGWIFAEANGIAPNAFVSRAVMVTDDYFIEEIRWSAYGKIDFELPIHFDGDPIGVELDDGDPLGSARASDEAYEFVSNARSSEIDAKRMIELRGHRDSHNARAFVWSTCQTRLFRATGPGQPPTSSRRFFVVRSNRSKGTLRCVWAWSSRVRSVDFAGNAIRVAFNGETHTHQLRKTHWQFVRQDGAARQKTKLGGFITTEEPPFDLEATIGLIEKRGHRGWIPDVGPMEDPARVSPRIWLSQSKSAPLELGEENYRRSELSWEQADRPTAVVTLCFNADELVVDIEVPAREIVFTPRDAANPFDNENADINGHGVQLYIATPDDRGAWVVVPDSEESGARVRSIPGWGALKILEATWMRTGEGFSMHIRAALPARPKWALKDPNLVAVDVIVNDAAPGRARRRGQLVLSGSDSEFVYLQGDRHDPRKLWRFMVVAPEKKRKKKKKD